MDARCRNVRVSAHGNAQCSQQILNGLSGQVVASREHLQVVISLLFATSRQEKTIRTTQVIEVEHSLDWLLLPVVEHCLCLRAEDLAVLDHGTGLKDYQRQTRPDQKRCIGISLLYAFMINEVAEF